MYVDTTRQCVEITEKPCSFSILSMYFNKILPKCWLRNYQKVGTVKKSIFQPIDCILRSDLDYNHYGIENRKKLQITIPFLTVVQKIVFFTIVVTCTVATAVR